MTDREPAPAGDAQPEPASGASLLWLFLKYVAVQVLIFFALYVLSIGPMYWQWYAGRNLGSNSLIAAFYEPLYQLAGWCEPFGEFMNWYVDLWIG